MGIYQQPNAWQCGPFALKHALIVHGIAADEDEIAAVAGACAATGADEAQLARAADGYACDLPVVRRYEPERARRALVRCLRWGIPALLCINQWNHWITAVNEEDGEFILFDSHDPAVITIAAWEELQERWAYRRNGRRASPRRPLYDLHLLVPRTPLWTRARFTCARARHLRLPQHRDLGCRWSRYLTDLLPLTAPPSVQTELVIPLADVVRRHAATVLGQLDSWRSGPLRAGAAQILDHLAFVAETYGLGVRPENDARTLAGVSVIVGLWAAAGDGVVESCGRPDRQAS